MNKFMNATVKHNNKMPLMPFQLSQKPTTVLLHGFRSKQRGEQAKLWAITHKCLNRLDSFGLVAGSKKKRRRTSTSFESKLRVKLEI